MYDVTNDATFKDVKEWCDEVKSNTDEKMSLLLVGNKIDMNNNRKVSYEEGKVDIL